MTVIEFYDRVELHNVASTLLCRPDRVIFIGDRAKAMAKTVTLCKTVAAARGISVAYSYRSVNKNRLYDVVAALEEIVKAHTDCVFDITGGSEVYLVAVGILMERYPGKIQCQRLRFKNSTVMDCDGDGVYFEPESFEISVAETVMLGGGRIKSSSLFLGASESGREFSEDIGKAWVVCRRDPTLWNKQLATLASLCRLYGEEGTLRYTFSRDAAEEKMKGKGSFVLSEPIFSALFEAGLIRDLHFGNTVSFVFKNSRVKRLLTTAGAILEWYIAKTLYEARDKKGRAIYHDVEVGVTIDWDGDNKAPYRTYNEIDVLAMRGAVPMFISCKNGAVSVEELYKLNTVAEQFGKRYAKKVLVATELDRHGARAEAVRARAADMGIRLIENLDAMEVSEISRVLSTLWSS